MRKSMLSLLAVAGTVLTLGGALTPAAEAAPVQPAPIAPALVASDAGTPQIQDVYYYGRPGWHHRDWRWRHHRNWRWRHHRYGYGYGRPY